MLCKHCHKTIEQHADPVAYVRPWCDIQTKRNIRCFDPMTNLEYLEWKNEEKENISLVSLQLRSSK
jgi:hypothetical protein